MISPLMWTTKNFGELNSWLDFLFIWKFILTFVIEWFETINSSIVEAWSETCDQLKIMIKLDSWYKKLEWIRRKWRDSQELIEGLCATRHYLFSRLEFTYFVFTFLQFLKVPNENYWMWFLGFRIPLWSLKSFVSNNSIVTVNLLICLGSNHKLNSWKLSPLNISHRINLNASSLVYYRNIAWKFRQFNI